MKAGVGIAIATLIAFLRPVSSAAENQPATTPAAPALPTEKWEFTPWRTLGERKASAGFQYLGPYPLLVVFLSKGKDAKPVPISRLKVTASDKDGKALMVAKYYEHSYLISGTNSDTAFFQIGTPVQKIQPKDVSMISISGFGGKLEVRFTNGNAIEGKP
jgi:hypothetical protein